MAIQKTKIFDEDNLLQDLNTIADFVIGNDSCKDSGYKVRDTLPEVLSFAMMHTTDRNALCAARQKIKELGKMVSDIEDKLRIMINKVEIKRKI